MDTQIRDESFNNKQQEQQDKIITASHFLLSGFPRIMAQDSKEHIPSRFTFPSLCPSDFDELVASNQSNNKKKSTSSSSSSLSSLSSLSSSSISLVNPKSTTVATPLLKGLKGISIPSADELRKLSFVYEEEILEKGFHEILTRTCDQIRQDIHRIDTRSSNITMPEFYFRQHPRLGRLLFSKLVLFFQQKQFEVISLTPYSQFCIQWRKEDDLLIDSRKTALFLQKIQEPKEEKTTIQEGVDAMSYGKDSDDVCNEVDKVVDKETTLDLKETKESPTELTLLTEFPDDTNPIHCLRLETLTGPFVRKCQTFLHQSKIKDEVQKAIHICVSQIVEAQRVYRRECEISIKKDCSPEYRRIVFGFLLSELNRLKYTVLSTLEDHTVIVSWASFDDDDFLADDLIRDDDSIFDHLRSSKKFQTSTKIEPSLPQSVPQSVPQQPVSNSTSYNNEEVKQESTTYIESSKTNPEKDSEKGLEKDREGDREGDRESDHETKITNTTNNSNLSTDSNSLYTAIASSLIHNNNRDLLLNLIKCVRAYTNLTHSNQTSTERGNQIKDHLILLQQEILRRMADR